MLTAADFIRAQHQAAPRRPRQGRMAELTPDQLHTVPAGHPKANTIALGHLALHAHRGQHRALGDPGPAAADLGGGRLRRASSACTRRPRAPACPPRRRRPCASRTSPLFREYMGKVWAGTEELFARRAAELLDKVVTVKPLGDMSVVQCLGQVGLTHGMTHLGEIELARHAGRRLSRRRCASAG